MTLPVLWENMPKLREGLAKPIWVTCPSHYLAILKWYLFNEAYSTTLKLPLGRPKLQTQTHYHVYFIYMYIFSNSITKYFFNE